MRAVIILQLPPSSILETAVGWKPHGKGLSFGSCESLMHLNSIKIRNTGQKMLVLTYYSRPWTHGTPGVPSMWPATSVNIRQTIRRK